MTLQHWAVSQLSVTGATITVLLAGYDEPTMRWRPAENQWSALDVICHMLDEDRLDFRRRLELTLNAPHQPLPSIDPPAWVQAHGYHLRDPQQALAEWQAEREEALTWLDGLVQPDWQRRLNHPYLQNLCAGDLLTSWVAHDLLHLRQLNELRYAQIAAHSAFSPAYAGDW